MVQLVRLLHPFLLLAPRLPATYFFLIYIGALNATLEGAGAIVGALMIGFLVLDGPPFKRRIRGFLGLAIVTIVTITVWSCALVWQVTFTRETKIQKMHYSNANYHTKGALYFFYYFADAIYQALAYWIMGAISNDPFQLARYAGFYKAVQSAGGAGSFGMDAVATPFLNEHLASWIMMLASFPLAGLVIYHVKDTSYTEEKTVFVDDIRISGAESGQQPLTMEAVSLQDVKEKIDE